MLLNDNQTNQIMGLLGIRHEMDLAENSHSYNYTTTLTGVDDIRKLAEAGVECDGKNAAFPDLERSHASNVRRGGLN